MYVKHWRSNTASANSEGKGKGRERCSERVERHRERKKERDRGRQRKLVAQQNVYTHIEGPHYAALCVKEQEVVGGGGKRGL